MNKLNVTKVLHDLQLLLPYEIKEKIQSPVWNNSDYHAALICYEKPGELCHRHLVADWLRNKGFKVEEFK